MSAYFVYDCPRCRVKKTTLECLSCVPTSENPDGTKNGEVFCLCRSCFRSIVLDVTPRWEMRELSDQLIRGKKKFSELDGAIDPFFSINRVVSVYGAIAAIPDFIDPPVAAVLKEGNTCYSVQCFNAAGAMYRLALDLATKPLIPDDEPPATKIQRSLGLRLQWLFDNGRLPVELKTLAECIQQDGNDGAHDGTLTKEDALDLQDFALEMCRRLYTEPERLRLAEERRKRRRSDKNSNSE